jgi:phosphohistidine swiveling domain-containing protein
MNIVFLSSPLESSNVGGKAASLSKLIAHGVAVPNGFVITKGVLKFYQENQEFPPEFGTDLNSALLKLKAKRLIIRSSAIGEDSKSHSFAGQLDSYVVKNQNELILDSVKKCWEGLSNDRLLAYQKVSGFTLLEMAVVVQDFVEADYAGVTFTQSPAAKNEVYTEYVKGAGEQLVAGNITPKNFSIAQGQAVPSSLPFNAGALIEQSQRLRQFYNCHLDIEWVAVANQIFFVQARPITVENSTKVFWSNTNLNENYPDPISPLLYSIARDSYYHYFKNMAVLLQIDTQTIGALEYDFSNTVGIWANRIYYNMTSIHNILSSSFLQAYFKDAFNQFVGYSNKDVASMDSARHTSILKMLWSLLRLNFGLENHVKTIENKVSSFSGKLSQSHDKNDLAQLFYEFLDLRFNHWYHASLADLFSMIHYKLLGKIAKKFYGEQSVGIHNNLIQAIPGLISSEPLNDSWDIVMNIQKSPKAKKLFLNEKAAKVLEEISSEPEFVSIKTGVESYLKLWGFRCSGELMFFKENYIERPEQFIELLQSYMRNSSEDPRSVIAEKQKERRKALKQFVLKIFKKRHILLPLSLFETGQLLLVSRLCKQAISSRERVRYKQAEMYYQFKLVVKEIAKEAAEKGLLNFEDDIFYLSYKEIGELISSSAMFDFKFLIEQRKKEFQQESEKSFPQHFNTRFGERPDHIEPIISFKEGLKDFTGLAASGGRIKGRVKVLESVMEGEKLNKGDILVTKQTDPGWAMVFPIIGGLIVERGGALSHGAIVAREFGIPAVIGIEGITSHLKDGDEVILDGDLGKIQILK